jgi:S-adenosylmethionine:tRNA ribosyltransferase-isomerase
MIALAERRFALPPELSASEPPEARGLARDEVRLMVASPGGITHTRFRDIGRFSEPGDLLVVNTSATIPAAVDGTRACGEPVVVHFSAARDDGCWIVELRPADGSGPLSDAVTGERVQLVPGGEVLLMAAHPDRDAYVGSRLWRATVDVRERVENYLARHGRPITYGYVRDRWPLEMYQTVFAREPGSAEMPSAARPFTESLVTDLVARGIAVAPVVLHAGVSSLEAGEAPQAERFRVPRSTALLVNTTRRAGGRVIAAGTTVTRALETVAHPDGTVVPGCGWTELVLGPERPARVVDGLITGWHDPAASHLLLLEAVAGASLVREAYDTALAERYMWHEFGDSCLFLPTRMR